MNNITICGRLTRDPELKYVPATGKAVANFSVAVNRRFKRDIADFFNVVVWDKQAESCANYISKGSEVVIAGEMQCRNYEDKDGKKIYQWELIAQEVQFVGSKKSEAGQGNLPGTFEPKGGGYEELAEEDTPF